MASQDIFTHSLPLSLCTSHASLPSVLWTNKCFPTWPFTHTLLSAWNALLTTVPQLCHYHLFWTQFKYHLVMEAFPDHLFKEFLMWFSVWALCFIHMTFHNHNYFIFSVIPRDCKVHEIRNQWRPCLSVSPFYPQS